MSHFLIDDQGAEGMRKTIAPVLVLTCGAASAEGWVSVQKPLDYASGGAEVLVDPASINGDLKVRHARIKTDYLSQRRDGGGQLAPNALSFSISIISYDCKNKLTHPDSIEMHLVDGTSRFTDSSRSPKWYPAIHGSWVEPDFAFVCASDKKPPDSTSTISPASPRPYAEASAIRAILDRQTEAWNRHDMDAFVAETTLDVDWVNTFGVHWEGRDTLRRALAELHKGTFAHSRLLPPETSEMREIAPNVVIETHINRINGAGLGPDGAAYPEGGNIITIVFVKTQAGWRIAHAHNTPITPLAAAHDPTRTGPP
jgi:uncharacterized protein (TIGR02246 family)